MYKLELDTVINDDETIESIIAHNVDGLDVIANVVHEIGPGGGWPVIAYTSTNRDMLCNVAKRYVGDDVDSLDDLIEMIESI